jgi:hypothetical protein
MRHTAPVYAAANALTNEDNIIAIVKRKPKVSRESREPG